MREFFFANFGTLIVLSPTIAEELIKSLRCLLTLKLRIVLIRLFVAIFGPSILNLSFLGGYQPTWSLKNQSRLPDRLIKLKTHRRL